MFISFSLAMDCFAVSIAGGSTVKKPCFTDALKVGLFFGMFQAVMPLVGWALGHSFRNMIESFDHWIAFCLLAAIGIKMLYEAFKKPGDKKTIITKFPTLLILSIATSIDALVIGISLAFFNTPIYLSVIVIGLFTFVFSITGYFLGHKIGKAIGKKMEIIGGVILIGIGVKVLIGHLL